MRANQQRELSPSSKEDIRLATIERLWGDHPQVKTAAKMFDEAAEREAQRLARGRPEGPYD